MWTPPKNRFVGKTPFGNLYKTRYKPSPIEPPSVPSNLGEMLDLIYAEDLQPVGADVSIRDSKCVASFNWLGKVNDAAIAIPGAPVKWTPPAQTRRLKEDNGIYYRDLNAAFSPHHPMCATAQAILACTESHATDKDLNVDIVACASTLRSLFTFTAGETMTFRIVVELIGDTVFFVRRENTPREAIKDVRGFGHSMPEAYTTWHRDVARSVSNQRILQYQLGDLKCLVRYESDGYLPEEVTELSSPLSSKSAADSSLETDLVRTTISNNAEPDAEEPEVGRSLRVEHAGYEVPQKAIFELKTRSSKRRHEDFFDDFKVRLWLTQTPWLVLGFHTWGLFEEVRISRVSDRVEKWERESQSTIKKFVDLLRTIVRKVHEEQDAILELWRYEDCSLEVRKIGGETSSALPIDVEAAWVLRQEEDGGGAPLG